MGFQPATTRVFSRLRMLMQGTAGAAATAAGTDERDRERCETYGSREFAKTRTVPVAMESILWEVRASLTRIKSRPIG